MHPSDQVLPLSALGYATPGIIVTLTGQRGSRQRLMDMGLTPGARIAVEGATPLGDPIIVWVRGSRLALRHQEAAEIMVAPCPRRYSGPDMPPPGMWGGQPPCPRQRRRWWRGGRGLGKGRGMGRGPRGHGGS